jgi:8-oxo-dGTP pyrophosphatase MutT (NUDIX family)
MMIPVTPELASFLSPLSPVSTETETWGGLPLLIHGYLSDSLPAIRWISSVRCVIFSNDKVLVVRSPDSIHVLPGGRLESGETLLETLHREVLEETGWTVKNPELLGFIHYHHLAQKPPDYPYVYPDFVQVVYHATASGQQAAQRLADEYEIEARFVVADEVQQLALSARDRLYLQAAIQRTRIS